MLYIHYLFILLVCQLLVKDKPQDRPKTNSEKNIEVQIIFPHNKNRLEPNPCLNVKVLIINHTDTAASFLEDWNSWGYFNIYFQVKSSDSTYNIYKKDRDWPKNFPAFKTLFPGDSMSLLYFLNYGYCPNSEFSGTVIHLESIKAIYQQNKDALEDAKLIGDIKYKRIYKGSGNPHHNDSWRIVDSLKTPVEINRTFPLSKLESKEYKLR